MSCPDIGSWNRCCCQADAQHQLNTYPPPHVQLNACQYKRRRDYDSIEGPQLVLGTAYQRVAGLSAPDNSCDARLQANFGCGCFEEFLVTQVKDKQARGRRHTVGNKAMESLHPRETTCRPD